MLYRLADLVERSGLPARTIRSYVDDGYLPRAEGRGASSAVYTEEHLLKAIAIARMRARGDGWDEVDARTRDASVRRLRALVKELDGDAPTPIVPTAPSPTAPPPPPEAAAPRAGSASVKLLDGVTRAPRGPDSTTLGSAGVTAIEAAVEVGLRGATELVMAEILPGLSLLLRRDAQPLVKRVAAEILEKYAKG